MSLPSGLHSSQGGSGIVVARAVPFNVFLAASMCTEGASFGSMQRGIGFAALMTAAISVLIVVVGSSIVVPDERSFTIEDL